MLAALRRYRGVLIGLPAVGIVLTACAGGRITDGWYIDQAKGFSVPLPSKGWRVETGKKPDVLLRHTSRQAGMSVLATCGTIPSGRPLENVSRHLFFGIHDKQILRQERRAASPEEALEVVLRGTLGGRELLLHAYTLKEPRCVYDLVLFAAPEDYPQVDGEFAALVRDFRQLRGETR